MSNGIEKKKYKKCLDYIEKYWKKLTFTLPKNKRLDIGLPNPFVAPNTGEFRIDQFYWDTYFTILGLLESGRIELAKGMVDNLIYLYKKFNIIPIRTKIYALNISEIPFLTSMGLEVFNQIKNKKWLKKVMSVAEKELREYWMDDRHLSYQGLSRYSGFFVTNYGAEFESGWDTTSRFKDRCLDYLPIDLNCCLYKYEKDLGEFYKNSKKGKKYKKKSKQRKKKIEKLMWDGEFFFDYNHKEEKISNFYSLAGFYPLWAKMVSKKKAKKMKEKIKLFEQKGGLANTQKEKLFKEQRQWDYPNGWPNQQWIVVKGLLNYGFKKDAKRIAKKWLDMSKKVFEKTGKFWEKYDVVKHDIGKSGLYPTQSGFGWTNSIFLKLVNTFGK